MKIECPQCKQEYDYPEEKIPPRGKKVRCRICEFVFTVAHPSSAASEEKEPFETSPREEDLSRMPSIPLQITGQEETDPVTPEKRAGIATWDVMTGGNLLRDQSLINIKKMIRFDQLMETDQVAVGGTDDFKSAGEYAEFQPYFKLKVKTDVKKVSAAKPDVKYCIQHPGVEADYFCSECLKNLCSDCVVRKTVGTTTSITCPTCKRLCEEIRKPRMVRPFWLDMKRMLLYPVQGKSWIALLFIGFFAGVAGILGLAPGMITGMARGIIYLMLAIYYMEIIARSAEGREKLPNYPDVTNFFSDIFAPGIKWFFLTIVVFIPLIVYVLFLAGMFGAIISALAIPLLIILGLTIYPMCMIVLSVFDTILPAMNPYLIIRIISRIKKEYVILLVYLFSFYVAKQLFTSFAGAVPIAGTFVAWIVGSYFMLVACYMMGRLVYQTEEKLDWDVAI